MGAFGLHGPALDALPCLLHLRTHIRDAGFAILIDLDLCDPIGSRHEASTVEPEEPCRAEPLGLNRQMCSHKPRMGKCEAFITADTKFLKNPCFGPKIFRFRSIVPPTHNLPNSDAKPRDFHHLLKRHTEFRSRPSNAVSRPRNRKIDPFSPTGVLNATQRAHQKKIKGPGSFRSRFSRIAIFLNPLTHKKSP